MWDGTGGPFSSEWVLKDKKQNMLSISSSICLFRLEVCFLELAGQCPPYEHFVCPALFPSNLFWEKFALFTEISLRLLHASRLEAPAILPVKMTPTLVALLPCQKAPAVSGAQVPRYRNLFGLKLDARAHPDIAHGCDEKTWPTDRLPFLW